MLLGYKLQCYWVWKHNDQMGYKTIGLETEGPLANSSGMEIKGLKMDG